jgi:hypothetical protein
LLEKLEGPLRESRRERGETTDQDQGSRYHKALAITFPVPSGASIDRHQFPRLQLSEFPSVRRNGFAA